MDEQGYSGILDGIYDAATAFERWPAALERIGQALDCAFVGLIDRNTRTMEGRAAVVGMDATGQRDFFGHWTKHDVIRLKTPIFRPGAVESDYVILPRPELVRSDFYNDFLKHYDMHCYLRMTLAVGQDFRKLISVGRPESLGHFESAEIDYCQRLMPHLQRAARVTQHVEAAALPLAAFSDVLEQSARGLLLLDRTAKVVFANRAARAMARRADGFVLRCERIEALDPRDNAALQRLIAAATGRLDRVDAERGGVVRLSRKSGKPGYAVAASALTNRSSWMDVGLVAFLLVTDPEAIATGPTVQQFFALTAAETRLAERLMLGESLEQAASCLDIRISTARWHLAALHRKTGTSRQAQLVRVLLSAPRI